MPINISIDIDKYQYGNERIMLSIPEEMVKVLENERRERYLETIPETVRVILSDYIRNKVKKK